MKRVRCIMVSLLLTASLIACSSSDEKEDLAQIDVMLDWYPNAVHSFLYVALEKGYFKEEGLEVNIQFPSNATDPISLAAAGKVTLGLYYQPDVIMARANQDIPIKSVGAIVREPLNYLIFKAEQNIESPSDLIDKKVGYPGIEINQALLATMMKDVDENPDDIPLIDVGFELGASIITEQVDAVFGAFINHEVPVLEYQGHNINYLNPVDFGVPNYYELVVVTGDETWNNQQEDIEAFWRAAQKGYDFMVDNPDAAIDILLANQDEANFPLVKETEQKSLEVLLPKMKHADGLHKQDEAAWRATAEWLQDTGLIEDIPEMDSLFVQ